MTWKILTAQIREEIYYSLTSRGLFLEEQKGCRKGFRGTPELLYIAMPWIDYKKAYNMVPQSWIINCLKMYKISEEVKLYRENYENLESGFNSRRKKLS